jgi:MFS family permease
MSSSRDGRLLAGAVFLSSAGDLLAMVVLALEVHELTGSGFAMSALFAVTLAPTVAAVPLAGLIADRFESTRVIVVASLAQAAVAAALAFTPGLAGILALAALLALGNAVAQPAEFALVPAIAGRDRVAELTGPLEAARYAGSAAGPLLAAGLAVLGPQPALLVNAASFAAVAAAALAIRARRRRSERAPQRSSALEGLRILATDPILRPTLGAAVGALLFISASLTVGVFYVKDVIGAGDGGYALLICAWMAAMVCGAMFVARRVPPGLTATVALVALAAQGAGMGIQTTWAVLPVALAGFLLGGLGHGVKNVLLRVLITERVPGRLHGRAFAAYNGARNAAELGAVAAGGLLVEAIGAHAALAIAGLGPLAAAAIGLTGLAERRLRPVEA